MRKVIFCVVIGDCDRVSIPVSFKKCDGWDYICFTDHKDLTSDLWNIVDVSEDEHSYLDPKMFSGKFRMLSHKYLLGCGISIYMDSYYTPPLNLEVLVTSILKEDDISFLRHGSLDCIYEQGDMSVGLGRVPQEEVDKHLDSYREKGVPKHIGLYNTSIIFRRHNVDYVDEFMEKWWYEYLLGCRRDQISHGYIMWKYPIPHLKLDKRKLSKLFGGQNKGQFEYNRNLQSLSLGAFKIK